MGSDRDVEGSTPVSKLTPPWYSTRWRIVSDRYLGFEVQCKTWWWPWWVQPTVNTSPTLARAMERACQFSRSNVVAYLGDDPCSHLSDGLGQDGQLRDDPK